MATPLPRSWYFDSDHHAIEMAAIFNRAWLPATHVSALDLPGRYTTVNVGGHDIILLRNRDGEIRAFHNVCQHRAHRLLDGTGVLKATITCPYHAWTYGLDGSLRYAPRGEGVENFDVACFGLKPISTMQFAGFVAVSFDETGRRQPPAGLSSLEDLLLADHPELPAMREVRRREGVLSANWKTIVENYLECYHCDIAHPTLGNFDLSTWKHVVGDGWSRQGRVAPGLDDSEIDHDDFIGLSAWWQWPNIFWARAQDAGTFIAAFHEPLGPTRTRQTRIVYAASGHEDEDLRAFNELFDDVFEEDVSIVESVQRGLSSRGYRGGMLMEELAGRAGWSEHAVHHFQDLVRDSLAANDTVGGPSRS